MQPLACIKSITYVKHYLRRKKPMKKIISIILVVALVVFAFAAPIVEEKAGEFGRGGGRGCKR